MPYHIQRIASLHRVIQDSTSREMGTYATRKEAEAQAYKLTMEEQRLDREGAK